MTETQRISWKRISVEAMAIVASILLAFAIDAWWDERQERSAEQRYLSAILADIDVVIGEVERTIAGNERHNESAQLRVATLRGGSALPEPVQTVLLTENWSAYRLRANLDSYTDLMSSGGVMLIRSAEVRGALSKLRSEMDYEQEVFLMHTESLEIQRPLLHESLDTGRLTIVARIEEDAIGSRRIHNARKLDVRAAAYAARDAVSSAMTKHSN